MSCSNRRVGRAWRRHDRARVARNRRSRLSLLVMDGPGASRAIGMVVNTTALCSCWLCRNPRRTPYKQVTLAEKRAQAILADGWEEYLLDRQ